MKKFLIPVLMFITSVCFAQLTSFENTIVTTIGDELSVKTDIAYVNIMVKKTDKTMPLSLSRCNDVVLKIKEYLLKNNIPEENIKIQQYNNYNTSGFFQKEFTAKSKLEIKFTDSDKLNAMLLKVLEIDSEISFQNILFDVKDNESIQKKLLEKINSKILNRKALLEESLKIKLSILYIEDLTGFGSPAQPGDAYLYEEKGITYKSEPASALDNELMFPNKEYNISQRVIFKIAEQNN